MFRRLPNLLTTLALASLMGLHWPFLQSIAWARMLAADLPGYTLAQAIQRTFDGKHPCALCKAIEKGKKAERRSERIFPLNKFDYLSWEFPIFLSPPVSFPRLLQTDWTPTGILHPPPTPPPLDT